MTCRPALLWLCVLASLCSAGPFHAGRAESAPATPATGVTKAEPALLDAEAAYSAAGPARSALTPRAAGGAALSSAPARAPAQASAQASSRAVPSLSSSAPGEASASAGVLRRPSGFERVTSIEEVQKKRKASAGGMAVLDFYADWCTPCKQMERVTFADQRVKARLAQLTLLQADVTRNTLDDKLLLKHYRLTGPPGIIFLDRNRQEIRELRVIGFEAPEKFLKTLDRALALR